MTQLSPPGTRFEDHFSEVAQSYRRFRPRYPAELFEWLAGQVPARRLAWDCGTGNGQAAHQLAGHFAQVIATDASLEQLAWAEPHARIEYRCAPAEDVELVAGSVDLISVATAIHWFDLPRFYSRAREALAPGGILAAWTYHLPVISPEIDELLAYYIEQVVGPFWPEKARVVLDFYRSLPFPFPEIAAPAFEIRTAWSLAELTGFLDSWSAARLFREAKGQSPIVEIEAELARAWGGQERRSLSIPLYLRVGAKEAGEG